MLRHLTDSFTRPADTTAYADNDLVANSTTAGSVVPLKWMVGGHGCFLHGAKISKTDETDVANATFSLHLFGSSPTVANGDNGAISFNQDDYIGMIPFAIMVAGTDDGYSVIRAGETGFIRPIACPFPLIYGLIQVEAAYSPASDEIFSVQLYFETDK